MRYNVNEMKVRVDIIRNIEKVGVREVVEDTFKVLSGILLIGFNVIYYVLAGKTAGGLIGVMMFPHLLSLQFFLTLLSLLTLQLVKKGRLNNEIERFSLFTAVLSVCYNVFISVLLGIYSIGFM